MGHALCTRNETDARSRWERCRVLLPALMRDALGLAGVALWAWAWLNWMGSI
ncbi:hypothetical protein HFP89_05395 [Wenzhouxiangella sp. XN79A]|uniref:hypothetical protein n=1 Tax=Wenzhouxiangella sp. XN79A TaxID=2724193 RepID=UPI00144A650E|nr:hypothetical protein [Wenzhouxiangella sp. XN79A]NKI34596.1 hypothetical protein [Wenzhouxiangella sp. XN79A]